MHRFFSTQELIEKADSMNHDHFDVYDEHKRTLLFIVNGAKDGLKKGQPGQLCADFIERAGGTFLVETRSANSGNARKVVTYVQCKKTFKGSSSQDPEKNPQPQAPPQQPANGYQGPTVEERIDQAVRDYENRKKIEFLESELKRRDDKKERTGEWLDMAFDGLVKGFKKHYPYPGPVNGGNATVNDENFNGGNTSGYNNDIDDCLDILCDILGEETIIKLANKFKNSPDPMIINMVKNYANN